MGGTGEECVEVVRGCDGALARDLHRRKRSLGRANKPPVGGECVPAQEGVGGGDLRPPGKGVQFKGFTSRKSRQGLPLGVGCER